MKTFLLSLILFVCTSNQTISLKNTQIGKVIGIVDGDTFDFLNQNKTTIRIRVDAIDAPEKGMPFYKVSKQYLASLCFGKMVNISILKYDQHGRAVARITLADGKDVSTEMIKAGLAWHYKAYSSDKSLANFETNARKNKIGLWVDDKTYEPWKVRKMHRDGISTKEIFKGKTD